MKKHRSRVWLNFAAALATAVIALTTNSIKVVAQQTAESPGVAVPTVVPFRGVLRDENGKPLSGTVGVTFLLYKEQQGSAPLWLETQNVQPDKVGRYSVMLGSTSNNGLPKDIFAAGEARWLGVEIAGQAEQPRVMLASVPYALKAGDAETIGGLPASAFVRASGSDVAQAGGLGQGPQVSLTVKTNSPYGTNGYLPIWTSNSTIQNSNVFQNGSGNVGIGTASPGAMLDVNGAGKFHGLVTFATGQTFPGTGTVTSVGSGSGITGGPITSSGTLSIDATKIPFLASANTFTGNQTVNGNLTATGVVTGSGFQIGSNLFDYGVYGSQNAFLGFAGNTSTTGFQETGSGVYALNQDTSGWQNTAVGAYALRFNDTGGQNTAIGAQALYFNTGGGNNTAIGLGALDYNTTGYANVATGTFALGATTTGNSNTGYGFGTGQPLDGSSMTGSFNTFLGDLAVDSTGTLSNAAAIGACAEVAQSNAMVLGSINGVNCASADTTVGIGTTTPVFSGLPDNSTTKLNIVGNNTYVPLVVQSPSTFGTWILLNNTSSGGKKWAILSAASGNGEGAGNLAITDFGAGGTIFLEGNVAISGNLSKQSGSFKIDHPLDPANKYLYHSFIESPDMMNIYNGNVTTNKRGVAVIVLPNYFEALNRDFRYQLTPIGQFAQAIVAREISHGRFTIKTSRPGVKVSWQVTGIRHDAYADAHRIQVEEEKPLRERGKYLHPELFGAPQEKAVGYSAPPSKPTVSTPVPATMATISGGGN